MTTKRLYNGFSTREFLHRKQFELHDVDLVKEDLINHIYTIKGERVMMPRFGTRIPEMVFEPLDDLTVSIVREDLISVFDYDPRVRTLDLKVVPDYPNYAINVLAELFYVELDMTNRFTLNIQFEEN